MEAESISETSVTNIYGIISQNTCIFVTRVC